MIVVLLLQAYSRLLPKQVRMILSIRHSILPTNSILKEDLQLCLDGGKPLSRALRECNFPRKTRTYEKLTLS
jgi:hypothetical protein